jgi:Mn-dependent DtxR family transcriptional regulator
LEARRKDPLDIAKEDVMRFLREVDGSATLSSIIEEIGEEDLAKRAVGELRSEGMIHVSGNKVTLSEKGRDLAERLYRIHSSLEEILSDVVDNPHEAAHSIEHVVTDAERIAILRGKVTSLASLKRGEEARILAILEKRPSVLSRLYGVGVLPGRKVKVLVLSRDFVVVQLGLGGRLATIDRGVAERIVVVREERGHEEGAPGRTAQRWKE